MARLRKGTQGCCFHRCLKLLYPMQALGNTSSKMRRELEGKSCIYGKIKKMLMNKEFRFRFWSKESNFRKLRLHFKSLDSGKEFCIGGIAESEKPKKKKNQTKKTSKLIIVRMCIFTSARESQGRDKFICNYFLTSPPPTTPKFLALVSFFLERNERITWIAQINRSSIYRINIYWDYGAILFLANVPFFLLNRNSQN